ncbi:MAG: VWA domain-containing protein [Candidatus Thiodiazotropha sp.]
MMFNRYRFVSVAFVFLLWAAYSSATVADSTALAEVVVTAQADTPIQWRLIGDKSAFRTKAVNTPESLSVPLGSYRLELMTSSHAWYLYSRLELSEAKRYQVNIDTGVRIKPVDGVSLRSLQLQNNKDKKTLGLKNRWGFIPLPSGTYTAKIEIAGQNSQITKTVTVTKGRISDVDFATGVFVEATDVPLPQRWQLQPIDGKGRQVTVRNRWGPALAVPGDYWLQFSPEGQSTIKYRRVTIKEGTVKAIQINSGFTLESPVAPEFYRLDSQDDNKLHIQSATLDTVYAPPGDYSLTISMPKQGKVLYEKHVRIDSGAITKFRVSSGVQVVNNSGIESRVTIFPAGQTQQLTFMNSSQGFIPLPAGKYRLAVATDSQTPIRYKVFSVNEDSITQVAVDTGVNLQVKELFGEKGNWKLKSNEGETFSSVYNRWGKALAPAGSYALTITSSTGTQVDYGDISVESGDFLEIPVDSGVHIDISDSGDGRRKMSIYRQGESEKIYWSNMVPSYVPLAPGKYRIVIKDRDSYVWGLPIEVKPGEITPLDEEFLLLTEREKAKTPVADEPISGFNIAKSILGGRVLRYSSQDKKSEWRAEKLIDGFDYFEHTSIADRCEKSCGWLSAEQPILPPEVTIGFHEDRKAWITAIVIDSAHKRDITDTKYLPKHVDILASNESPDSGFTRIAGALLMPDRQSQLIQLADDVQAKYIKVRVLSSYGGSRASIGEIGVIESADKPSIVSALSKDLARPENGGSLAWFTSQSPGWVAAQIVWQGDEHWNKPWRSHRGPAGKANYLPQDFVFGFYRYQIATIDKIVIDPTGLDLSDSGMGLRNYANEVVIEHSMLSPITGFTEIVRVQLAPYGQPTTIKIDKKARFIKIRIVSTQGNGGFVSLGRVSIFESNQKTGESILRGVQKATAVEDIEVPDNSARQALQSEVEPNDQLANATPLTPDQWISGVIDPLGEQDVFRLSLLQPSIVDTQLISLPFIQTGLEVLNGQEEQLYRFSPQQTLASNEAFTLRLDAGNYFDRLGQATNSIVLVWDTSGSMKGSEAALEKAVMGFVEQTRPSEKLQLIRFGKTVEVLTDAFSNDLEHLKQVASDNFTPKGGTPLYEAILKAIELLEGQAGNRVIVLMSDGFTSLHLEASEAEPEPQQVLVVVGCCSRKPRYRLKASIQRREGLLKLSTRDELLSATTALQSEIILDASGSMVSSQHLIDGKRKIDVAKSVLNKIVYEMPQTRKLGFRVFGHRIKEYQPGDCQDTELVHSIKQFSVDELTQQISKITATNGTTPLSYSILQAAKDFLDLKGRPHIVLVTDGQEYCGADPQEVVRELLDMGMNIRIDIVGMDLKDSKLRDSMGTIARMTKGEFQNIKSSATFERAIQSSLGAN